MKSMGSFGFDILQALVNDIVPAAKGKQCCAVSSSGQMCIRLMPRGTVYIAYTVLGCVRLSMFCSRWLEQVFPARVIFIIFCMSSCKGLHTAGTVS